MADGLALMHALDPGSLAAWAGLGLTALLVVERVFVRAKDDTAIWRRRVEEKLDAATLAAVRVEGRLTTVEAAVGRLYERAERWSDAEARLRVVESECGVSSGPVGRR